MARNGQAPDLLRMMMMLPSLQDLSDQHLFYSLIEINQSKRMELLEIAKADSATYE